MVKDTSPSSRILDIFVHVSLVVIVIITLYPVLHIASMSLSEGMAVVKNTVTFYPIGLNFDAYIMIFETSTIPRSFRNSILYTSVGTVINILMTIIMAYPLSKKRLTFRGFYTTLVIITMFFSGGLIPSYLVVRALGMYNTLWALVIPGAIATWNLIILRTFFQAQPVELEESAYLDGANDINILIHIVAPLSKAAIATIGLFYMVGHWNSWFPAVIYLRDMSKYPLQLILREIVIRGELIKEMLEGGRMSEAKMVEGMADMGFDEYVDLEKLKYATLFASIIPMLVVYPFIQRYFVKGVMIGSLKG